LHEKARFAARGEGVLRKAVASLLLVVACQAVARAEVQPAVVAAGESTGPVSPERIAGYLLIGAGLVAVTAGSLLAYSGASQASEANARLAAARTPAEWDRSKGDFDAGKSRNQTGWVLAGVGAAGLVAGAVMLVILPERRPTATALAPWLTAGAGGLALTRAF
jgi:hypothetical protein